MTHAGHLHFMMHMHVMHVYHRIIHWHGIIYRLHAGAIHMVLMLCMAEYSNIKYGYEYTDPFHNV